MSEQCGRQTQGLLQDPYAPSGHLTAPLNTSAVYPNSVLLDLAYHLPALDLGIKLPLAVWTSEITNRSQAVSGPSCMFKYT